MKFIPPIQRCLQIRCLTIIVIIILVFVLQACSSRPRPFRIKNIAKADIDLVADAHLQEVTGLLMELTRKLYKRNPRELRKIQEQNVDQRMVMLFKKKGSLEFEELNYKKSIDAMLLCFDKSFRGDRVFALMAGFTAMIRQSYNNKEEFFILDRLHQQKLYNSARNIEILVWRLSNKKDSKGDPFLLTNNQPGETQNLSFERLFGKMIALQDMMARITADRNNRAINRVVHSVASATFLPVAF